MRHRTLHDVLDGAASADVDARLVDAVARRVLQLLGQESAGAEVQLLTVGQVAHRLQVHPNWVYDNARRLGARRLGDGPKAPLRFDPYCVAQAFLDGVSTDDADPAPQPTRKGSAGRPKRGLLPIADA